MSTMTGNATDVIISTYQYSTYSLYLWPSSGNHISCYLWRCFKLLQHFYTNYNWDACWLFNQYFHNQK